MVWRGRERARVERILVSRFAGMAKRFRNIWEIALKSDEILPVSCEL